MWQLLRLLTASLCCHLLKITLLPFDPSRSIFVCTLQQWLRFWFKFGELTLYLTIHLALVKSQSAFFAIFSCFYRKFSLQTHWGLQYITCRHLPSGFVPVILSAHLRSTSRLFIQTHFPCRRLTMRAGLFVFIFPEYLLYDLVFGCSKVLKWINIITTHIWVLRWLILPSQLL